MRVQGAKPVPFLMAVGLGLALRFLVPIPVGITVQAWTLLSIFVSTIAGKLVAGLQHQSDARATTHHHTANPTWMHTAEFAVPLLFIVPLC
jgi:hypothetical protein